MSRDRIIYRGAVYRLAPQPTRRLARTREDVMWSQVAEAAQMLVEMAKAEQDAVVKRELVRDVWNELRAKIATVGLW